jgi:hypothetical protein
VRRRHHRASPTSSSSSLSPIFLTISTILSPTHRATHVCILLLVFAFLSRRPAGVCAFSFTHTHFHASSACYRLDRYDSAAAIFRICSPLILFSGDHSGPARETQRKGLVTRFATPSHAFFLLLLFDHSGHEAVATCALSLPFLCYTARLRYCVSIYFCADRFSVGSSTTTPLASPLSIFPNSFIFLHPLCAHTQPAACV